MAPGLQTLVLGNPLTRLMRIHHLLALLVMVGLAAVTLVSCHTTAGLGRDMQKVGDKIEDSATRKL
jgi:predicted small secreted protein